MKIILTIFSLLFSCAFSTQAQIITTIAGSGIPGYSGDNGPATAAGFYSTYGVAVDDIGNVFLSDSYDNRIRKIDATGIITTIAGNGTSGFAGDGGPATSGIFYAPVSIALDGFGGLFICERYNYRVRKIDMLTPSPSINTATGNGVNFNIGDYGPATAAGIAESFGIATDNSGNIYIATAVNPVIRKITRSTGIITTVAGTGILGYAGDNGPATAAQFNRPFSITIDDMGNIYIGEMINSRVRKIDTNGITTTYAGTGIDGYTGDGIPATTSGIYHPTGLATDGVGNLYIADRENNRIRKVSTTGIISTIAGIGLGGSTGDGGPATAAQTGTPTNITLDAAGNIYFTDGANRHVRKISMGNHVPAFPADVLHTVSVCQNTTANDISATLTIADADTGQTETWLLLNGPTHGAVSGFTATTLSTGGTVLPTGITYTPAIGYTGMDSFKVKVHDGTSAIRTTIYINVTPQPTAGTIAGTDSICPGDTVLFTDAITGGAWSSSNTAIATVAATGQVTGAASGTATISYTVANMCDTVSAVYTVVVRPAAQCETGFDKTGNAAAIKIYPNPSAGSFTISLPQTGGTAAIEVMDIIGRTIQTTTTKANTITLHDIPAGTYMVKVILNGAVYRKKVVVVR